MIMKKIILFLFLVISTVLFSQDGIKFGKQSFAKTLEQAKKENKLIFLDAFASWCGPCKLLDKNVFPKKEVGDYFNANFLNLHIDMEKGEGIEIAKKYSIYSYPTLLFIDGDGKVVYKAAGYMSPQELISIAKEAVNPENTLENKIAKFEAGEKEPEFLKGLIKNTYATDFSLAQKVATRYFQTRTDATYSKEEAGMLLFFTKTIDDDLYKIFTAKKAELSTQIPESYLAEYDKQLKLNTVLQKSFDANNQSINEPIFLAEGTKIYGEKEAKQLLNKINMDLFFTQKKYEDYAKSALNYYQNPKDFATDELNNVAWNFYLYVTDKTLLTQVTQLCLEGIKKEENSQNTDTLANIYYKLGDNKNAKLWAKKSIEIAKAKGDEYASTEELLKKIN
ncbi:thiol:disulfide interchange protein [Cloacibacterium normanense]|uniref:Thiol:disulfide interchange protein n=2 Tax=Cloacibacterium normanense TaxID=237258 RepID=A0A2S7I572_9FLAO|nr:thiol:disulfide interchange protein [Cloacibacterium normanense]